MLPRAVRALRLVATAGLVLYALHSALLSHFADGFFEDWLANGLLVAAGVLCAARGVIVARERAAWLVLGFGVLAWAGANVLDTFAPSVVQSGGFPTLVDAGWLAFYPAAYATLVLLVRARLERRHSALWLDGIIGALAASALVAATVFPALVAGTSADTATVIADLAYPVLDVLLLGSVLAALALTGWRPGGVLGLVAAAFVVGAAADILSLLWAATGHDPSSTRFAALWPASALLLGYAAWRRQSPASGLRLSGWRLLVCPALFAVTALGLLFASDFVHVSPTSLLLAELTLLGVVVRMAITYAENLTMAERNRQDAITDALTGLGNRRRLLQDLSEELETASAAAPRVLALFDLDGFKRYNDSFGHPAGDALLARLGASLAEAMRPYGRAYRLGGDEFCVLIGTGLPGPDPILARGVEALSAQGKGFSVSTSCGAVLLPTEAGDVQTALQAADHRLYAQKGERRRHYETRQTRDVLLQVLREREPELHEHLRGVAALAQGVARRMELSGEQLDEVARAAELHDIGKIAVPDAILGKPGKLDDLETAVMREHAVVGERILAAAPALTPVARLVRFCHERYDGRGYPDGLSGEEIPLGARVIAVCDAYAAMLSERPYQAAVAHDAALAELRRCAGTQFDPGVVATLIKEIESVRSLRPLPAPPALELAPAVPLEA